MSTRRSTRLQSKEIVNDNGLNSPAAKRKKTVSKNINSIINDKEKPIAKSAKSILVEGDKNAENTEVPSKTRTRKVKSSYFESPVESENESDYEPEPPSPPSKKRAKIVKKARKTFESESESSSEEFVSCKPNLPILTKSSNSKASLISSQKIKNSYESESDSSTDEFEKAPESLLALSKTEPIETNSIVSSNSDLENDTTESKPTEYFDFSSLVSQVTEASKITEPKVEVKPKIEEKKPTKEPPQKKSRRTKKSEKKSDPSINPVKTEQLEVFELLAMGEDTDLSAKDIKETVANSSKNYDIPEQVEVLLDAPPAMKKKRCNDLEIALRRRLNNIKRENQVYIHKVHVLCYIAHGNYLNSVLNSCEVLSVALSILPSEKCYPPKRMNMEYLEDLLNWFGKKIKIKKDQPVEDVDNLCIFLQDQLQKREAVSKNHFCFLFLCLMRALGIRSRLIINLNVVSIKPSSDQLLPVNQKNDEPKPKPSPSSAKKDKTPAKSSKSNNNVKSKDMVNTPKEKKKTVTSTPSTSKCKDKKPPSSKSKDEAKPARRSGRQTQSNSKYFEDDEKEEQKSRKVKKTTKKKIKEESLIEEMSSTDESDFEDTFVSPKKKKIDRRVLSTDDEKESKESIKAKLENKNNYWIEVFLEAEEKWFCVDVVKKSYHCSKQLYNNATHPVRYVLAWNNDQTIKDVTRRYVPQYLSVTRKLRVDDNWWNCTMKPYKPPPTALNKEEDEELDKILEELPIPASISECKNHPLYALKRHLLKFQGIYPPDAIPVGYIKGEPVYSRLCVQQLHGREMWIKEAKVVKLNETPYKIVKGRPQKSKFGISEPPKDLELFGSWQVEDYVPPTAENGKVPRNAFGNVELFKPSMLPKGTVYLQIPGLQRIANKLSIDCAAAITGFEYSTNGWSYPVKDGFVVCEEFKDILLDAYNQEVEEAEKKEKLKREERVYANWKRLIKGLFIREKLKRKYNFGVDPEPSTSN